MELTVYNRSGQEVDKLRVDETVLGGAVRYALLKQAIVMYQANRRQGTVKTKGRSEVAGSDKKLFRQKGTGNARVGNRRTGKRVGGGMIFAKVPRDFRQTMPRTPPEISRARCSLCGSRSISSGCTACAAKGASSARARNAARRRIICRPFQPAWLAIVLAPDPRSRRPASSARRWRRLRGWHP